MGRLSLPQLRDYHRGMLLMYRKHYAPRRLFLINWLVYLGIAVRFLLKAIPRILSRLIVRLSSALPESLRRSAEET